MKAHIAAVCLLLLAGGCALLGIFGQVVFGQSPLELIGIACVLVVVSILITAT